MILIRGEISLNDKDKKFPENVIRIYTEHFDLLHAEIRRLERLNDEKLKEIRKLRQEIKQLAKEN